MSTTACKKLEENLVGLIEHTLPPELQEEIQAHLADCPGCAGLVRDFSLLWEELSTPREKERPVSLWPSLERKLRARRERRFRSGAFITGFLGLLRPAAVSLAVLIAVLAGIQLGRPRGESASGLRLSELSPELKAEAYASLYLEPFSDIPEGSLADFYLGAEAFEEERSP